MSFPIINLKATSIELTPELTALVDQKILPLEKFLPSGEVDLKCEIELERMTDQQSGKIFRAEINLYVDGTLYRAEATEDQMEKAIDTMRDEVKKEIRRANAKKESLMKRGARKIKDMIRFGGE